MLFKIIFLILSFTIFNKSLLANTKKCDTIQKTFSFWSFKRNLGNEKKFLNNCSAEYKCSKNKDFLEQKCFDIRNPDLPFSLKNNKNFSFIYKGYFIDGFLSKGTIITHYGVTEEGEFRNGQLHGNGSRTRKTLNGIHVRKGKWWKGRHYKGTWIYPSKNNTIGSYSMTGTFNTNYDNFKCFGQLEGKGKYESLYEKPFKYNNGLELYGFILEGKFKCSKLIKGKEFNDYKFYSTIYEGKFNTEEQYDGKGKLQIIRKEGLEKDNYLQNGKKIKLISGIFKNDVIDKGKISFEDGSSLEGYFVKGKFNFPKTKYMEGNDYKYGTNDKVQNFALAKKNYLISAQDGYKDAMIELAKLYKDQKIQAELTTIQKIKSYFNNEMYVKKISLLKAHMWANLAGDKKLRDSINLDAIHILEAQNLAYECKLKEFKNC